MKKFYGLHRGTFLLMSITLISSVLLFIYQVITKDSRIMFLDNIISSGFLVLVYISILILTIQFFDRRGEKVIVLVSILFLLFNSYQVLSNSNVVSLPENAVVENFYGKNIMEVITWADKYGILIEQVYEHSDNLEKYTVIGQDTPSGTLIKDIKKIKLIVSDGADDEKDASVPNMVGWTLDEALKFIDENFLTNVEIEFKFDEKLRDTIIGQSIVGVDLKRNDKITLTSSLGDESDVLETRMEDLVGKDLKTAEIFLKRNRIFYEIEYAYFEDVEDNIIKEQSIDKGFMVRTTDKEPVIITVAKKDKITVPNLKSMTASEITKWATTNQLKVYFEEEFDDTITKGKVIESTIIEGEVVAPDTSFTVTLSKGRLVMIDFTSIEEFRSWADENEVSYDIEYQFSNLESGKLISSSHKTGAVIKNSDTVHLVISQGSKTTVPNFIGKTKDEALKLCSDSNLKCSVVTSESDEESGTVIKQSMRNESVVPVNTSITLTVSE